MLPVLRNMEDDGNWLRKLCKASKCVKKCSEPEEEDNLLGRA